MGEYYMPEKINKVVYSSMPKSEKNYVNKKAHQV